MRLHRKPRLPRRALSIAALLALVVVALGATLYLKPLGRGAHAAVSPSAARDLSGPMLLIASPELEDPIYGAAVIVATPVQGDRHVGFIINWPTDIALSDAYPDERLPQELRARLYVGGPYLPQSIFALVCRSASPAGKAVELAPGLYAALDRTAVDDVIRVDGTHARYVIGLVVWQQHELEREVDAGVWSVVPAEPAFAVQPVDEAAWDGVIRRARETARRASGAHPPASIAH
jgi:putative AlgH/UPF0301 family transcriptional regulator